MIFFCFLIFSVHSEDYLENEITALRTELGTKISRLYEAFEERNIDVLETNEVLYADIFKLHVHCTLYSPRSLTGTQRPNWSYFGVGQCVSNGYSLKKCF
jgi:hypothetical protein